VIYSYETRKSGRIDLQLKSASGSSGFYIRSCGRTAMPKRIIRIRTKAVDDRDKMDRVGNGLTYDRQRIISKSHWGCSRYDR
jgi:hypothetical protein